MRSKTSCRPVVRAISAKDFSAKMSFGLGLPENVHGKATRIDLLGWVAQW